MTLASKPLAITADHHVLINSVCRCCVWLQHALFCWTSALLGWLLHPSLSHEQTTSNFLMQVEQHCVHWAALNPLDCTLALFRLFFCVCCSAEVCLASSDLLLALAGIRLSDNYKSDFLHYAHAGTLILLASVLLSPLGSGGLTAKPAQPHSDEEHSTPTQWA